ncbi:MAG TPA: hypothetical protein VM513_04280 [Kofleriaceae bacterium]|nr:hypothetical protein [Kofleriaceae bacterium]
MKNFAVIVVALSFAFTACGKKSEDKKESAPAPSGAPAEAKPVDPKPAEPAAAAPAAAAGEVDLAPGGDAWKGLAIKGPADSKVSDNGAGGVGIVLGNISFEITPGKPDIKTIKDGIKFGLETSKGTITYSIDKPDEIAYVTETPMGDGKVKGYGFAHPVTVDGKTFACSTTVDTEEQAATAKAACDSLHKK